MEFFPRRIDDQIRVWTALALIGIALVTMVSL